MLDLGDVLDSVVDGLDAGALAQENPVGHAHESVLHVVPYLGGQVDAVKKKDSKRDCPI